MVVPRQVSSLHPGFSPAADRIVAEGRALDDAQGDHRQLHRAQLPEGPVVRLDARSAAGRSVPASDLTAGSGAILAGLAAVLGASGGNSEVSDPDRRQQT